MTTVRHTTFTYKVVRRRALGALEDLAAAVVEHVLGVVVSADIARAERVEQVAARLERVALVILGLRILRILLRECDLRSGRVRVVVVGCSSKWWQLH